MVGNSGLVLSICGITILFGTIVYISTLIMKSFVIRQNRGIMKVVPRPIRHTDHDPYRYHLVPLGYHDENFKIEEYENFSRSRKGIKSKDARTRLRDLSRLSGEGNQSYDAHYDGTNLVGYSRPLIALEKLDGNYVRSKSNYKADYTPLLIACWDCDVSKIKASIALGADTHEKTKSGETGLILATYRMAKGKKPWNPDCLDLLLKNGCPINEVTNDHNTALHLAVKIGHLPSIEWLLANGACVRIPNKLGWRPMAIAKAKGLTDVLDLLWKNYSEEIEDDQNEGKGRSNAYHSPKTCFYCEVYE